MKEMLLGAGVTLIAVGLIGFAWLVFQNGGWSRIKGASRYYWYRVWFKADYKNCITCNGSGKRPISGGIVGSTGVVAAPSLLWDCVWCDGTGKTDIAYTYRFKRLTSKKTPAQLERDRAKAEQVLGPPEDFYKGGEM